MKNTNILYGIIGLLLGLLVAFGSCAIHHHSRYGKEGMKIMDHGISMKGSMEGMMSGLSGKTGEDFDKAFIEEMIMHHEGAVSMAQAALTNATHQEIKDMAQAIISAQTKEIDEMKSWHATWFKN